MTYLNNNVTFLKLLLFNVITEIWTQTYTVLGTDYKTYSIVSGCLDGFEKRKCLIYWQNEQECTACVAFKLIFYSNPENNVLLLWSLLLVVMDYCKKTRAILYLTNVSVQIVWLCYSSHLDSCPGNRHEQGSTTHCQNYSQGI